MAGPLPTTDQILAERADLEAEASSNEKTLEDYANNALANVKRDLEDERSLKWAMVFDADTDEYVVGVDEDLRNDDRIKKMITLSIVSLVYKDSSSGIIESNNWLTHLAYHDEYWRLLTTAKLDEDLDEDGTADTQGTGQAAVSCSHA